MGKGSKEIVTGYNYSGSFAQIVCAGPVDILISIKNGDTVIFDGPILSSSADGLGRSTIITTLGTGHFYWGSATQSQDPDIAALQIDYGAGPAAVLAPAWRNVAYFVALGFQFGGQVVPPTLEFEVTRYSLGLGIGIQSGIGDDANPAEIIYWLLTDQQFGAGVSSGNIITSDFTAAASTLYGEALGITPLLNSRQSAREMIGQLLTYIDGFIYLKNGKIGLKLIRKESTGGIPSLTAADMLEEPLPSNKGYDSTWNFTNVNFVDRDNKYEQTLEQFQHDANGAILDSFRPKDFNLSFIHSRATAKQVAKRIAVKGGIPDLFWSLTLKPKWRTLTPGELFFLSYAKFGLTNKLCRVTELKAFSPLTPEVEVECIEEKTRDSSNDYTPGTDNFVIPSFQDAAGKNDFTPAPTTPRLSILPTALKAGQPDGYLVAMNRPDSTTTQAGIYWTWDPAQSAYKLVKLMFAYPRAGTLLCWHRVRNGNWLLRVQMATQSDLDSLTSLVAATTEIYAVVGQRHVKIVGTQKSEHEVLALWLSKVNAGYFVPVSGTVLDIEVTGGAFGTSDLVLESTGADSICPAAHVYFGRQADFAIIPSTTNFERPGGNGVLLWSNGANSDTDQIRYIKAITGNHENDQALADVTASTYDRNDTTMCPDGTFSTSWGDRALTTYEYLNFHASGQIEGPADALYSNVSDLDVDLRAIYDASFTDPQFLLAEQVNAVLGRLVDVPDGLYTLTP